MLVSVFHVLFLYVWHVMTKICLLLGQITTSIRMIIKSSMRGLILIEEVYYVAIRVPEMRLLKALFNVLNFMLNFRSLQCSNCRSPYHPNPRHPAGPEFWESVNHKNWNVLLAVYRWNIVHKGTSTFSFIFVLPLTFFLFFFNFLIANRERSDLRSKKVESAKLTIRKMADLGKLADLGTIK